MPGLTSIYGIPYLEPSDPPDLAGATQGIAEAAEVELQRVDAAARTVRGGTVSASFTASQVATVTVSFGGAFSAPPALTAMVVSASGTAAGSTVRATAVSASSATLVVSLTSVATLTISINWVAVL